MECPFFSSSSFYFLSKPQLTAYGFPLVTRQLTTTKKKKKHTHRKKTVTNKEVLRSEEEVKAGGGCARLSGEEK